MYCTAGLMGYVTTDKPLMNVFEKHAEAPAYSSDVDTIFHGGYGGWSQEPGTPFVTI
jgi:hypothetical protein